MKCAPSVVALFLLACRTGPAPNGGAAIASGRLETLLRSDPRLAPFVERAPEHRLQLLVSTVVPGEDGKPFLERHGFRVDAEYVYPASAIKTCAAIAALQKLAELAPEPTTLLDAALTMHPLFADEIREDRDESNLAAGTITVGHEIRKLFLVSDNRAFNRLYEFVGHEELNRAMWRAGLSSVRLRHRLSESRSAADNRRTPPVDLLTPDGRVLSTPARTSDLSLPDEDLPGTEAGRAWIGTDGELHRGPFTFRGKNRMSLVDLQDMHVAVLRPELTRVDLGLGSAARAFLAQAMSELPRDSRNPRYDPGEYPDEYVRFLLPGLRRVVPAEALTVYDKVGRAYGFSVENAAIVDQRTGRWLFVAAVLYTNPNETLNDGEYGYEELADPFFVALGEVLAREFL